MKTATLDTATVRCIALVIGAICAAPLSAQSPTDVTEGSDVRAQQTVEAAMRAHGGRVAVLRAHTLELLQEERGQNPGQARLPGESLEQVGTVHTWMDGARRKLRRDIDARFPGGDRFNFSNVVDGDTGFTLDLRGNRTGRDLTLIPPSQAAASWAAFERLLPHLLLQQTARPGARLRFLGEVERAEQSLLAVLSADSTGGGITLLFDPQTGLMRGHERVVSPGSPPVIAETEFFEYEVVSGIQVPRRLSVRVNRQPSTEVRFLRVTLGAALPDTLFAPREGYLQPPLPGEPAAVALATGIYLLDNMPGGYRSMFVEMDDHVVVLEGPQSPAHTQTALRLIRTVVPEKPINYVLATHHHSDHTAGLGPYIGQGATIVGGREAGKAIRPLAAGSGREAVVEEVQDRRILGSADRRVEIYPVPNVHAGTMLMFYFPAHRLIFQGDLLTVPTRGALPPATELNESLLEAIRRFRLDVQTIVGVHGRTATVDELREIVTSGRR